MNQFWRTLRPKKLSRDNAFVYRLTFSNPFLNRIRQEFGNSMSASSSTIPSQNQSTMVEHHQLSIDIAPTTVRQRMVDFGLTVLAWSALVAIFAIGYMTGWKLPTFSSLTGNVAATNLDWCAEHSVPESKCIECNPKLLPKPEPIGFCLLHGVAECVFEHPELSQLSETVSRPKRFASSTIFVAKNTNSSRDPLHKKRIQFPSKESIDRAGIDVGIVEEKPMKETVAANAELVFDPTRVARLSTRVAGSVAAMLKITGERVQADDILAIIDAAEVGKAKSQLVQAAVQLQLKRSVADRLRPIALQGAIPPRIGIEAETSLQEALVAFSTARQALANLGFNPPSESDKMDAVSLDRELQSLGLEGYTKSTKSTISSGNLFPIRAPMDGVVTQSNAVVGEVVQPGATLITIADPLKKWLMMNFNQDDAGLVRIGSKVVFESDSNGGSVEGKVTWVSPTIDDRTRTVSIRANIIDNGGQMRNNTFGTAKVFLREEPRAIVVPKLAIQSTSDATFVFVRDKNFFKPDSPLFFHVRQVAIGTSDESHVELLAGVLPGEVVATKGSASLLAQLLKSNLGAGCGCCEE